MLSFLQNGLLNFDLWSVVLATLGLTHITIASVTIFLHRHQSHSALTLHPAVSHFFRFWLWLTTGMVTKEWVAIHRKHHAKCESDDDPHSPQRRGINTVLWRGSELYRTEGANQETLDKYGQGTPDDWLERKIYGRYPFLGISLMLLIDIALFGAIGITVFAVQMLWIPFWAAGVINGIGHFWGYRNFETTDASRNIVPVGILIGGEELHNNHHAYASSARLSNKWWEFDIGWFYIRLLENLALARVKKVAPKVRIEHDKHTVDMETMRALVRNRFHVMKLYSRKVICPVIRQEQRKIDDGYLRQLLRRVRKLMSREDIKLDSTAMQTIQEAIQHNHSLEVVYQYKEQLKELWVRTSNNQAARVQRLQQWCRDAEQTGIEALQNFARILRGYSMQTA